MTQLKTIGRIATKVRTDEHGTTYVRYHDTNVVAFDEDTIVLNTGGYFTVTTKNRMNQTANQFDLGYHIYQDHFLWYVVLPSGQTIPFINRVLVIERSQEVSK